MMQTMYTRMEQQQQQQQIITTANCNTKTRVDYQIV